MTKAWIFLHPSFVPFNTNNQILDTNLQLLNKLWDLVIIHIELYFNIVMYITTSKTCTYISQMFFGTNGVYEHCCSTLKCKVHDALKFRACN